jgi:hypothetical protein
MPESLLRAGGVVATVAYAALIGWLAASQPQSLAEVTGGLAATFGAYEVDAVSFDEGLRLFRQDQFEAARSAWSRADPAGRDARTQFYVAYSYYRQGWGRMSHDDALYAAGLDALSRAVGAAPGGRVTVSDPDLQLQTADELEVLLVHPGGPFWVKKDLHAWSVPKGGFTDDEDTLNAAKREFLEETGVEISGDFLPLSPVKMKSGK